MVDSGTKLILNLKYSLYPADWSALSLAQYTKARTSQTVNWDSRSRESTFCRPGQMPSSDPGVGRGGWLEGTLGLPGLWWRWPETVIHQRRREGMRMSSFFVIIIYFGFGRTCHKRSSVRRSLTQRSKPLSPFGVVECYCVASCWEKKWRREKISILGCRTFLSKKRMKREGRNLIVISEKVRVLIGEPLNGFSFSFIHFY